MVEAALQVIMPNHLWCELPCLRQTHAKTPDPGSAHVYAVPLKTAGQDMNDFTDCLSTDELDRAGRFQFDLHRTRFVLGRGWLRRILSSYLDMPPARLRFSYGTHGKPTLMTAGGIDLQFNLAHSEDLALVAVTRGRRIGIDIERVRNLNEFDELVRRFFSENEAALFGTLPAQLKPPAFFNLWTRKEAMLKATGEGIAYCLNQVEVTFSPEEKAKLLRLPERFGQVKNWDLDDLAVAAGFAAALAIEQNPVF